MIFVPESDRMLSTCKQAFLRASRNNYGNITLRQNNIATQEAVPFRTEVETVAMSCLIYVSRHIMSDSNNVVHTTV